MTTSASCSILGFGRHLPERVLTNHDLEKIVETSDEWIVARTGIRERRLAAPGECTSDLAALSGARALEAAGMQAEDLSHIILASLTPDMYCGPASATLAHKLGVTGKGVMDLNAACSGFLTSLETARGLCALSEENKVLVCAAEVLSSRTNWEDRNTCVLFGDGSGAVVVGPGPGICEIVDVMLNSDGELHDLLTVKGGGSARPYTLGETVTEDFFIQMEGREVFKHAVRSMRAIAEAMLDRHGLTPDDIDRFVTHQANKRIIEALGQKLGIASEKVFTNVERYGNTSAASIPIALSDALEQGAITKGDTVLLATFGGGFTWGSALLQF
jgi:3-oxoacyl-[acyl-carrier-protein] synthase-3